MATATTLAAAINVYYRRMADTRDFLGTPLRNQIAKPNSEGGDSVDFKVQYGSNTSTTTYVEGDAPAAAGNSTFASATLAASGGYVRTMHSLTGHASDYMRGGIFDGAAKDAEDALDAHMHYKEDLVVTAAEADIDSAGSLYGLLRATYNLASYEAAVTPTLAEMQTMWQTQEALEVVWDASRQWLLCGTTFKYAYLDVAVGVAYFEFAAVKDGVVDAGKVQKQPAYNGRPMMTIPTMTATTCLVLDPTDLELVQFRPITVDLLGKTDDSDLFSITSSEIFITYKARQQAKLT
jgi:hypothetical protein